MILNRIFNVQSDEWSKVVCAWILKFLLRISLVVAWTLIIAMFVARNGIYNLPFLFIFNAIFSILGTLLISFVVRKVSREKLMIILALFSAVFFTSAWTLSLLSTQMFFMFLFMAEGIFLVQIKIALDGFIEEKFSPLQSERTFSLIESSETVAGVAGGVLITSLSDRIDTINFVFFIVSVLLLFSILVLLLRFPKFSSFREKKSVVNLKHKHIFVHLRDECFNSRYSSFVAGLFIVVLLQWLIFNLLEFQYTAAVYQSASGVILEAGSGFEHVFVHDLGKLFILFSASTLIVQFFLGSRLVKYLGVIGTMILHAIVTFLSFVGLFLSFNFYTAILAKNNFSMTSALNTTAYQSAYYAISSGIRDYTREILEGIVRPAGALLGTALLIVVQKYFSGDDLVFVINILLLLFAALLIFINYRQQNVSFDKNFAKMLKVNLTSKK